MTYLSIIEKLKILFNTLLDFEFVLIFTVLLLILTFLYMAKQLKGKKYVLLMFLSFALVFGISIISNYKVLSDTFDNFTTIFFGNIYFPSIYVYIGVLVISFIAFITSMLNVMLKKIYKVINSIMFVVNNVLLVVVINIIAKNKIDIFSVNSLYTNTSLVAVLELSMGLFILWILALTAVYATNAICDRMAHKKVCNEKVKEEVFNPVLEVSNDIALDVNTLSNDDEVVYEPALVEGIVTDEKELVVEEIQDAIEDKVVIEEIENTTENEVVVEEITNNTEDTVCDNVSNEKDSITFSDILNGNVPVTYYDNSANNEEYNLIDPQMIYEDNYNKIKSEVVFNDINIMLDEEKVEDNIINNNIEVQLTDNIEEENIIFNSEIVKEDIPLSVEELTRIEKGKVSEERLAINTVSLNDLIDDEITYEKVEVNELENNVNVLEVKEEDKKDGYTIDDYKKIIKMLNSLKDYGTNINIDDAVAISLISNYSIDDCMKFKNILENNLN